MASLLLESLSFGLAIAVMAVGVVGILIPLVPGMLLTWVAALLYVIVNGFDTLSIFSFVIITVVAVVTGTADFWLPILGAKQTGASGRSLIAGTLGGIAGTFVFPVVGTVIGYAGAILIAEYLTHRDWQLALKAALGGAAGWGLATAVQLGGAILIILIFIIQVFSA